MNTTNSDVPEGFGPLFRTSPLLDALGPFYGKGAGAELTIGLRVAEKHTNSRGGVHGGVLATIGDVALGYTMASSPDRPRSALTASLTIDYVGSAKVGDWIEAHVTVQRMGVHLAFASCNLQCGQKLVLRASGVFAIIQSGAAPPSEDRFDG